MEAMKVLALVFLAAQAVTWTDCAEGPLCDKDCAQECGDCCESESCAHLDPQFDVLSEGMSVDLDLVSTSFEPPVFTAPDVELVRDADGHPPPRIERPLYAFLI